MADLDLPKLRALSQIAGDYVTIDLLDRLETAERERNEARKALGECYLLSGADPDGDGWEHNWSLAVDEVRRLSAEYGEACDQANRAERERDEARRKRDEARESAQQTLNAATKLGLETSALRAQVADFLKLGVSMHKTREADVAAIVAYIRADALDCEGDDPLYAAQAEALNSIADAIARGDCFTTPTLADAGKEP